jgi:hypothetical protein
MALVSAARSVETDAVLDLDILFERKEGGKKERSKKDRVRKYGRKAYSYTGPNDRLMGRSLFNFFQEAY